MPVSRIRRGRTAARSRQQTGTGLCLAFDESSGDHFLTRRIRHGLGHGLEQGLHREGDLVGQTHAVVGQMGAGDAGDAGLAEPDDAAILADLHASGLNGVDHGIVVQVVLRRGPGNGGRVPQWINTIVPS